MEVVGVEPTMPEAADLQSAGVTSFPTLPLPYRNILLTAYSFHRAYLMFSLVAARIIQQTHPL